MADEQPNVRGSVRRRDDLSTDSEVSTPGHKKPVLKDISMDECPADDAPPGVWCKFLFKQFCTMNDNFRALSDSTSFASDQAQQAMEAVVKVQRGLSEMNINYNKLALKTAKLEQDNIDLHEHILNLECHQRRNNLVFEGITENRGETDWDVYNKIVHELSKVPHIGEYAFEMQISRCHRLGPYLHGKTRPVIAHIHWYGDRQLILRHKQELPNRNYVREDFLPEIEDRNRFLRPIAYAASRPGSQYRWIVRIDRGKLILDGKVFTVRPKNNLN